MIDDPTIDVSLPVAAPRGDVEAAVREAVAAAIARGEPALGVAVYHHGELVADVFDGIADEETGKPVDEDTLFWIASVTKSLVATALHIQAERGLVDYEAPVAEYWPEFARHGKDRCTVQDALSHRAGVPIFPSDATPELMVDYHWVCDRIANMHPIYDPGTKNSYHSYTHGYIVGEVIRRTDPKGRSLSEFVHEELFRPLGADDIWLGIPADVEHRVCTYVVKTAQPGTAGLGYGTDTITANPNKVVPGVGTFMRSDVRRSCHPGAGVIANARSVAKVYAMLAGGGTFNGVRLLSPERIALMSAPRPASYDLVLGERFRGSIGGFWLPLPWEGTTGPMGDGLGVFGHTGSAGNIAWCDPRNALAVAITAKCITGRAMAEDNPVVDVANAIRRALGISK
jgi:CubicO group peptidase (beta-lactamase class C family)